MAHSQPKKTVIYDLLLYGIFSLLSYLYIWLLVRPELYFQNQQPAFYLESQFFSRYTFYPGGIFEYVSAFFAQFYLIPAVGAAIIAITLLGITLLTKHALVTLTKSTSAGLVHFIPAILLLMMHNRYGHSLAGTLGLLLALLAYTGFVKIPSRLLVIRIIVYLLVLPLLYYFCGGPALFAALLCVLSLLAKDSLTSFRRILAAFLFLVIAALLPFISVANLTIAPLYDRLTQNLILSGHYRPEWLPYLLYGFYPLSFLIALIVNCGHISNSPFFKKLAAFRQMRMAMFQSGLPKFVFNMATLLIVSGLAVYYAYDRPTKTNLQLDSLAHRQKWEQMLLIARNQTPIHFVTAAQMNRALYHTGRMLETMFAYPQDWGSNGLLIPQEYGYAFPLEISNLFFDMGSITESQHWAYEAQAVHIDSPWNLQRLFLTHLLKRNTPAARRYLFFLQRSPLFRKWAIQHQPYLDDPSRLIQNADLRQKYNLMPMRDFIVHGAFPQDDLQGLLDNNPDNKMAFEYYMAYCLLTRQLDEISRYTNYLIRFQYPHIPRHLEEAFLIYLRSDKSSTLSIPGYQISKDTMQQFKAFLDMTNKYRLDPALARQLLYEAFGTTYWFYYYFHKERDKSEINLPALAKPGVKR
jgi:hypothetical protein